MLEACNQGKGKAEVHHVIVFLERYVVTHFRVEEQYMQQYGYSGFEEHKLLHHEFVGKLQDLKKTVERDCVGVHTVIVTNRLVVSWFVNHIRNIDIRLGDFLNKRSQRGGSQS